MKIAGYQTIKTIAGDDKMRDAFIYLTKRGEQYYITKIGNVSPYHLGTTHERISTATANKLINTDRDIWTEYCETILGY